MCGIAGFSLSPNSKIKPRQLSNALLTAIEDRGYMASGYGFHHDGMHGYHSAAIPGSSLSLKFMPRKARTVILHTRLATHGAVTDNRNNHPVTSPDNNIALVHNGVIYNHAQVRPKIAGDLPPVDTSVIPALIEQYGIDDINQLDGDAAIAWLDKRDPDTLHLARYQHSPLVFVQVEDGSFIFASTEALLWRALIQLDIVPTFMHLPDELTYYTIRNGVIQSQQPLPAPLYADTRYDYSYFRHQTAGAKGSAPSSGYESLTPYGNNWYDDDFDSAFWEEDDYLYPKVLGSPEQTAEVYKFEPNPNEHFWTEIATDVDKATLLWYGDHERELWLNELYMMANEPGVTLIDYGTVNDDGVLVPTSEDVVF